MKRDANLHLDTRTPGWNSKEGITWCLTFPFYFYFFTYIRPHQLWLDRSNFPQGQVL